MQDENQDLQLYRSAVLRLSDNRALVFGGRSADGKFTNALKMVYFDSTIENWVKVKDIQNDFPAAASSSLTEISKNRFMIIGGILSDGKISNVCIDFSITDDGNLIDEKTSKIPFGVYGHRKV